MRRLWPHSLHRQIIRRKNCSQYADLSPRSHSRRVGFGKFSNTTFATDPSTVAEQIRVLKDQFKIEDVVMVGYQGMIKAKGKFVCSEPWQSGAAHYFVLATIANRN